jgi:hypothetical protein
LCKETAVRRGKEMQTDTSRKLIDEFLSSLKTTLGKKRFKCDVKLIKRHAQLYRFYARNKTHFLFIHVKPQSKDFFRIPPLWQEISGFGSSIEDIDWAVILLKERKDGNYPLGFQIPSDEFIRMKSSFTMDRMGLVKIKQKDLSSEYQFNSWDTFFQLLNL